MTRKRPTFAQYGYLLPFAVLSVYGLMVLAGWITGSTALVQPRPFDAPLPANAGVCLILIGLFPIAYSLGWKRTSLVLGFLTIALAGATFLQGPIDVDLRLDNLLVRHEGLIDGPHTGRMSATLALIFLLSGLLLVWFTARAGETSRPIMLALVGSLSAAYGLTGLLADRIGLNDLEFWRTYALIGPHAAAMVILLGAALILLAARDESAGRKAGPRWLWLPAVVCSLTVTGIFWVALGQRELGYINGTTQLTINNIAALFSGESETHIESLARLAAHWKKSPDRSKGEWENDAAESLRDFQGYRSIEWVDADLHTRWFWPQQDNGDAPFYDHAGQPLRRAAAEAARASMQFAIAAPLESPL